jgi:putative hydrolase of the HAD superfamily
MVLRSLLFDLDNTLYNRDAAAFLMFEELIRNYPDHFNAPHSLSKLLEEDQRGRFDRGELCQWIASYFSLPISADQLWQQHLSLLAEFTKFDPKLPEMLEILKRRYRLALVSNGSSRNQRRKLEILNIAQFFDTIVISAECGYSKPAQEIFKRALLDIQCKAESAIYIGDHPSCDIVGAASLGMSTVWVSSGDSWPAELAIPTYQIANIHELIEFLNTV